jgi:hypothetical protein
LEIAYMSVVIWGQETNGLIDTLQASLRDAQYQGDLIADSSIHGLRCRLLDHRPEIEVLVLSPRDTQELMALIDLRPLMTGLRIIMLLPEDVCDTAALAHRLVPRYAASAKSDPGDVAAVLLNLIRPEKAKRPGDQPLTEGKYNQERES